MYHTSTAKLIRLLWFLCFTMLTLIAATNRLQNGILFQEGSLENAMEKAYNRKAFTFVHTTSGNCTPCNLLAKNFYPNQQVAQLYNTEFVNYQLNVDELEYYNMANILNLGKNATLIYIEPTGNMIRRVENVSSVSELIKNAEEVIDLKEKTNSNWLKLEGLYAKVQQGFATPNEMRDCAYLMKTFNQPCTAIVNLYLDTQNPESMATESNRKFLYDFLDNVESHAIDNLLNSITYYKINYGSSFNDKITLALYNSLRIAVQQRDDRLFEKIMYVLNNASLPFIEDQSYFIKAQYYEGTKNFEKFADITTKYLATRGKANAQLLVVSAEKFFLYLNEDRYYKKALDWTNSAISIEGPTYRNHLIKARLLRKLDNSEALTAAKIAKTEALNSNIDTREIDGLIYALEKEQK